MTGLTWPEATVAGVCILGVSAVITAAVARARAAANEPSSAAGRIPVTYRTPPDGYEPPTGCAVCRQPIRLTPILGGAMWLHINPELEREHPVAMRPEGWWDATTGRVVHDTARADRKAP